MFCGACMCYTVCSVALPHASFFMVFYHLYDSVHGVSRGLSGHRHRDGLYVVYYMFYI